MADPGLSEIMEIMAAGLKVDIEQAKEMFLTFGIGHIVNFFSGQASFETVMQIIFAISWGFILTIVVAIIYCTWLGKIKNEKTEDIG